MTNSDELFKIASCTNYDHNSFKSKIVIVNLANHAWYYKIASQYEIFIRYTNNSLIPHNKFQGRSCICLELSVIKCVYYS